MCTQRVLRPLEDLNEETTILGGPAMGYDWDGILYDQDAPPP